jgi:phosphoribosyl-ATP pyrophosphohydrolase
MIMSNSSGSKKDQNMSIDLHNILIELYEVILDRREHPKEGSYTCYLWEKGLDKILKKVGEEAAEVIIGAKNCNKDEVVYESADLIYHLLVLWAQQGVKPDDVLEELRRRR